MEGVKRTNAVMVRPQPQGAGFSQRNPYTIDMNKENRNCYIYGGFGHMARNCKNRMELNRRIDQVENTSNNLNEDGVLESSN